MLKRFSHAIPVLSIPRLAAAAELWKHVPRYQRDMRRMNTETEPFDFLKLAGLGRKKKNGPDKKYATFNRRMLAATIDSLLLLIVTLPLLDALVPIHNATLQQYVVSSSNPAAAERWPTQVMTDRDFIVSLDSQPLGADIYLLRFFRRMLAFLVGDAGENAAAHQNRRCRKPNSPSPRSKS